MHFEGDVVFERCDVDRWDELAGPAGGASVLDWKWDRNDERRNDRNDEEDNGNTKYIKKEIVIDIKYMEKDNKNIMVIDSGALISLVSSTWFEKYIKEAKINNEDMNKTNSY